MDAQRLVSGIAQLSRTATGDFSVEDLLRSLCEVAAASLPVHGAGVMAWRDGRSVFVHATSEALRAVERVQERAQDGPCMEAFRSRAPTAVPDILGARGWPEFRTRSAELGLGSVLAVPLVSRGRTWGSLDLYRRDPGPWSARELEAAQVLADVAVSYVVMARDRDDARTAHEALARRALHDDLTGLPNRRFLFERLETALQVAGRTTTKVAVVFVDVDSFKEVNDTYGHTVADQVLVELAHRLRATLRGSDTLARFAGDEFVVVCEGLPDEDTDELLARMEVLTGRLREAVQHPLLLGGRELTVSASMGVAVGHRDVTAEQLLAEADAAMYAAKRQS